MARANSPSEVFKRLTEAGIILDGSGSSTTTDTSATEGDTTLSVNDESVVADGDLIRVDADLDMEIHTVASTTTGQITLSAALGFDHASGVTVQPVTKTVLGDVTDDGVSEELTADLTDVGVATQQTRYTRLVDQVDGRLEFSVQNVNTDNMLVTVGIDDADVSGSGTGDDPYVAVHDPQKIVDKPLGQMAVYLVGVLEDGTNVEVQGWNAEIDPNRSRTWNTGDQAPVPVAFDVSTLVLRTWS